MISKIKTWILNNWKWILVVPIIVISISHIWKAFIRPFIGRFITKPRGVDDADRELDENIDSIRDGAGRKIGDLESEKNDKISGIGEGNPDPASIFNEAIRKKKQ
jgi:hypothetical protein